MKYFLILASVLFGSLVLAGNLSGVIYKENSTSTLDDCLIVLLKDGQPAFSAKSNFDGTFTVNYQKNEHYVFEVSKVGYKTESVEILTNDDFVADNPSIEVYLKVLGLKPKFEKIEEGVLKDIPNPDMMEDIGSISSLPKGYKIIDAKPLKYKDVENTGFNVNRNAKMEYTNVNIEVLKKEFNKEEADKVVFSELDKSSSSYYTEGAIFYGPGRASLTENVREVLDGVADELNNEPLSMLRLIAYADADKEALIGDYIGKLRVEEITKYLMSRKVQFSQLGISVVGNTTLENECYKGRPCSEVEHQQNRKVELLFAK